MLNQQVDVRGCRIELANVEAALSSLAGVRQAVVLPGEDLSSDHRLIAYVVLERGIDSSSRKLHSLPNGLVVSHINAYETRRLFEEVFIDKSYLQQGICLPSNACVFDIGANIGMFTLFICNRFPQARVFAFEPVPSVHACLSANIARYGLNAEAMLCGLGARDTEADITFYPHMSTNSGFYSDVVEEIAVTRTYLKNKTGEAESWVDRLIEGKFAAQTHRCQIKTLSQIIAQHAIESIDLLKIDVEKSEWDVLAGIDAADWSKIKQVVVEIHNVAGRLLEIRSLLERHGFVCAVVQESELAGTDIYQLYARKPAECSSFAGSCGDDEVRLITALTSRSLSQELRANLRGLLPEYMVPETIVQLSRFPLTANGNVDRTILAALGANALREMLENEPRTRTEENLGSLLGESSNVPEVVETMSVEQIRNILLRR